MATTNPVLNVLVSSGNQAPLAAGSKVDALANGQLGIFNYHTGLSVDGSVPANAKDFFIAVGINRTTGGTDAMEDFNKSAGQMIQSRNVKAYTVKGYTPAIQKVVTLTGFTAKCDTDYAVKLLLNSVEDYTLNGYNGAAKTFAYRTACCEDTCDTCPKGDAIELAVGMANVINADIDKIFVATLFGNKMLATIGDPTTDGTAVIAIGTKLFNVALLGADSATQAAAKVAATINADTALDFSATSAAAVVTVYPKKSVAVPTTLITLSSAGGTGVTVGTTSNVNTTVAIVDAPAFKVLYPNAYLSIKITTNPETRPASGDINVKYHKLGRTFEVAALDGFSCNGTVTTTVEPQTAEGLGYDLKQLEYVAQGWKEGGPYRTQAVTGLALSKEYFVNTASNYNVISIQSDKSSYVGKQEYENFEETIIAIPCADSTTLTGIVGFLDLIIPQFRPMTNDVASMDCTNTNTSTINNIELDGIETIN